MYVLTSTASKKEVGEVEFQIQYVTRATGRQANGRENRVELIKYFPDRRNYLGKGCGEK
jgi:hypothetical protein